MQITEITFASSIQLGEGLWHKIGAKAILGQDDNPDECYGALKSKVEQWVKLSTATPVIQGDSKLKDKLRDFNDGWALVKKQLQEIEFKEDAQIFLDGLPEFKDYWEAKTMVFKKSNKNKV